MNNLYPKLRACLLAFAILLLHARATAQVNSSGIINSYYKITAINTAQSSLDMTSTAGLSLYDYVVLIQMKGAAASLANNSSFGSISSYNDAGNYEINVICGIEPTRVYLLNKIARTYDPVNGYVQIVRMPSQGNTLVTGDLQTQPWDKTTGTGGVLALMVNGRLTLNANITATNNGFSGGPFRLMSNTCNNIVFFTNYYYNAFSSGLGGNYKGEGIVDVTNTYGGGRGAIANGGGGGNGHNNGAAGGGNLVAGGDGGNNTSSIGCKGDYPGIGAYALSSSGGRIYMGGGGGTGHGDNTPQTWGGGNGGGIVIIKALELQSNGYKISANGSAGSSTTGDGASGGGAGGTIIFDVASFLDSVRVEAQGGVGGNVDNQNISGRTYGSGGGGSGGVIYYTGSVPPGYDSTSPGGAGVAFNSNPATQNGKTGAGDGDTGLIVANYTLSVANTPETYCNILLSSKYLSLTVSNNAPGSSLLKWRSIGLDDATSFTIEKSTNGLSWQEIGTSKSQTGKTNYSFVDGNFLTVRAYYRIKTIMPSGVKYFSNVFLARESGSAGWIIVGNPAKDYLYINGLPSSATELYVYDARGVMLKKVAASSFSQPMRVDISSFAKGVYYVRCDGTIKGFLKE